jgi:hypothetical protein
LFNLVADGLATLLTKAKERGLIRALVPNLVDGGGLTHLQYADDTIIFLEADKEVIANAKFLLYYFENMFGMKLNYHKSEVVVVGATDVEGATLPIC